MSLKAFHIAFVVVSTLFTAGFGVWSIDAYMTAGQGLYLFLAVFSLLAAVALVVYGGWFLKKMKNVSFL